VSILWRLHHVRPVLPCPILLGYDLTMSCSYLLLSAGNQELQAKGVLHKRMSVAWLQTRCGRKAKQEACTSRTKLLVYVCHSVCDVAAQQDMIDVP
jgi:hypothetical protein